MSDAYDAVKFKRAVENCSSQAELSKLALQTAREHTEQLQSITDIIAKANYGDKITGEQVRDVAAGLKEMNNQRKR